MATTMMTTTVAAIAEQSYYRRSRRKITTTTIPTSALVAATAAKSRFHVLLLLLFLIVGGTTNVLVSTAFVITTTTTTTHNNHNHYHDELSVRRKKTTTTKTMTMTKHLFSSSSSSSRTFTPLCVVHPHRPDNINDENVENTDTKELLSVAPMMGHTNRHYRYYYRLLSKRTYLYTEMIPSSQIVSAYNRAKEIYNNDLPKKSELESNSIIPTPNEIINVVQQVIDNPSFEYQSAALASKSLPYEVLTLHQLLATSCSQESPVVLQLGGNDPTTLGIAAAIGAAWGRCSRWNQDNSQQNSLQHSHQSQSQSQYIAINLNCGCPSNAVGGRAGGCALMATPELVLECVDSMRSSIDEIYNTLLLQEESSSLLSEQQQQQSKQQQSQQSILSTPPHPPPTITVKHRLGIRDAISYNATCDRLQNDDEAFNEVSSFIRTVSSNDSVSTFHVHARLGILGDFVDDTNDDDGNDEEEEDDDENNNNKKKKKKIKQTLWVPTDDDDRATITDTNTDNNKDGEGEEIRIKIDHKREQEKARRRSRRSTIKNRDVPPLRPNVIYKLTAEFPHLDFVSNGGITNMREVVKEVTGNGDVMGAMVGRTIINHPCSFAAADQLLWNDQSNDSNNDDNITSSSTSSSSSEIKRRPTRGDILLHYIKYCDEEEDRIVSYGASQQHIENLRRRLIAVPYHLFVGENGSDKYQRRIIKLKDKLQIVTTTSTTSSGTTNKNPNQMNKNTSMKSMKASTILKGAMSFIPKTTLDKCIDDYVEWNDILKYDHLGGLKRGSALQRVVY
jgi:tRNA-dihydrouridine synthase